MPELPEVETIVRELKNRRAHIIGARFLDVWTDTRKLIKKPKNFSEFKKQLLGRKIEKIERRGKNILFRLSEEKTLLAHQKMTGHFLLGEWVMKDGKWQSEINGPLSLDPMNKYIHLIFWLSNKKQLALSDLRKFAKVELWDTKQLKASKEFSSLGPEALPLSFCEFEKILRSKRGKIKKILLDQKAIAGIGNIYSDEMLFKAGIHPTKEVRELSSYDMKRLFKSMKEILKLGIKLQGESFSDFRRLSGKKGNYDKARMVYRKTGEKCPKCESKIERIKVGGRSAHFCPNCQKL